MADGFDIHLNDEQAQRLKAVAEAAGLDPAAYAVDVLEQAMQASEGGAIHEDAARWAEYERTGETVPLAEALEDFHVNLAARLAEKA